MTDTDNIKVPTYHISWLQMAIENHLESSSIASRVVGDITLDEYIKYWCAEDLKKVIEMDKVKYKNSKQNREESFV